MRKTRSSLFLLFFGMVLLSQKFCEAEKWEPPSGKMLIFIGQDKVNIESYISSMGQAPAGIMHYANLSDLGSLKGSVDYGAGSQDLPFWINRPTPFLLQIGLYLVNMLEPINSGSLDANIDEMALLLRNSGSPVFLRIGYEFDSDWAGYDPVLYQKAYRRIVDRFRKLKVDNVAFVWHSWGFHYTFGRMGPDDWYPGDDYVDWCALSFFSPWNDQTRLWSGKSRQLMIDFAKAHGKPLMIAESSTKFTEQPSLGESSWKNWFIPFFRFADSSGAKAICYINADWDAQPLWQGKGWGDSRIQQNEIVKLHWLQEISKPRYLMASDSLVKIISGGWDGIHPRDGKFLAGLRVEFGLKGYDWLGRWNRFERSHRHL
jgi:hypothetical protein